MKKQRGKIGKYSKVSLQKKYELIGIIRKGQFNIRDVSQKLKINYSTAKTILFQFQKKKCKKMLSFFLQKSGKSEIKDITKKQINVAAYKSVGQEQKFTHKIEVLTSINGKFHKAFSKKPTIFVKQGQTREKNGSKWGESLEQSYKIIQDNLQSEQELVSNCFTQGKVRGISNSSEKEERSEKRQHQPICFEPQLIHHNQNSSSRLGKCRNFSQGYWPQLGVQFSPMFYFFHI